MKDPQIYTDGYQLALSLFHRTKSFGKHLRPTLGRKLEETAIDLVLTTKKAMFSKGDFKVKHLHKTSEILDEIRILIQLSRDLEMLTVGGYSEICLPTKELGKEIGGLLRHEDATKSARKSV